MANKEHIEIVLSGAEAIREWKVNNPEIKLDLQGASLRSADLTYTDLSYANMSGVDLHWADLRWADLIDSDLSKANLTRADLHKADLENSSLQGSDCSHANFEDASLVSANLSNAIFSNTRLINTDLSLARGIDTIIHKAASELDRETLAKNTELSIPFLKGCGLYSAFRALILRVVVGSPGDVEIERKAARDAIYSWNDHNAHHYGAVLLPVLWETHAIPELGDRPQAIINRQLIETSQILVCIFWSRLGTPTGEADSGTVEEIMKFMDSGNPVLVYFCTKRLPQTFDPNQWSRLQEFKSKIKKKGLIAEFETEHDLISKMKTHLTEITKKMIIK